MENERRSNVGAQALAKNIRMSVVKVRRVAEQIQGCSYEEALVSPEFMPYKVCYMISQLVLSAAANATSNMRIQQSKATLFFSL